MTSPFVADVLAGLAAVALGLVLAWSSWLSARALLPATRPATRMAGAVAAALWLSIAGFWLLAVLGAFRLPFALVLFGGLAWWSHRRLDGGNARVALAADLRAIGAEFRRAGGAVKALVAGLGAFSTLALLRGTLAPPLGWDALTYHLLKAGRFVQAGGLVVERAPDAWSYYEYFPVVGDVLWSWAMLPGRSDLWLTLAGTAIFGAVLLAVYALARELGASPRGAALAALATGSMPAVLAYLSSAYVDNTTLLLFLLGAIFVVRFARGSARLREAVLVAGPLALMVGTKITTGSLCLLGVALVGWLVLRSAAPKRTRALVLAGCLVAILPGTPSYLRAWLEQGSPLFPFPLEIAGRTISSGTEAMAEMSRSLMSAEGFRLTSRGQFWASFLWRPAGSGYFVNPGLGAPLLALLALAALPGLARDRSRRLGVVFLLGGALLVLAGFLSSSMELFRVTIDVATAGRFVTIGLACVAALAATLDRGWAAAGLSVAGWCGLLSTVPLGLRALEARGLLALGGIGLLFVLGGGLLLRWSRGGQRRRVVAWCAIALLAALGAAAAEAVRSVARYSLWQAAADPKAPLFHMHPLHAAYTAAWPIWRALDDGSPHRLAVTAGWDRLGHNWYRYPLLGSRLQNLVLYVPIAADGATIDYLKPDEVARKAEFKAWVARLVAARVDYVVSLAPRWTIEDYWMTSTPQLFEKVLETDHRLHAYFRFHPEMAAHSAVPAAPK